MRTISLVQPYYDDRRKGGAAYAALAQLCGFMHPQLAPGDVKNRWYLGASIIGATAMAKLANDVAAIRLRCPHRGGGR